MFHKPANSRSFKRFLPTLLIVVAISGAGGTYYFYHQYHTLKANPSVEAQKETTALVAAVGKLMVLPTGETPTIATISDKSKLTDQVYFKNAANGDKIFIYNAALLAILYRPQTNKIINVAPISMNQPENTNTNTNAAATSTTNTKSTTTNTNQ